MTRVYLTKFYETSLLKNDLVIYIPLLVDNFTLFSKRIFCIENYLLRLSEHSRIWITKFRTSNLHLPIETGRWYNIPREDRICLLCKETIGDEYHFLLVCKNENIITLRNKYLPNYYRA